VKCNYAIIAMYTDLYCGYCHLGAILFSIRKGLCTAGLSPFDYQQESVK